MNVIVSNKANNLLSSLQIDVIKKIQGEFSVEEIISIFENFFYQRMILDITAIRDYKDVKNIQNLSIHLDTSKIIILLDGSAETSSREYISKLISMGIYNFTQNIDGVIYLLNHPNSYKDVASMHQIEDKPFSMMRVENNRTKVIGFKNLTENAGSSSLIFMLKRQLQNNYVVKAIEIDSRDFLFYSDKDMISTTSEDLGKELLKLNGNVDIVLIDLNKSEQEKACNEVLYLIEPSIIKMNKFVSRNREKLPTLLSKKVILNKSLLSEKDIREFEMESGIKIFYSIPPLNDRYPSEILDNFLVKLGFLKQRVEPRKMSNNNKLFGIFKRRS